VTCSSPARRSRLEGLEPPQRGEHGEEALAFRRREPPFPDGPRPGLILLDLTCPGWTARGAASVKADPTCVDPVVNPHDVVADEDIVRSYDLHANAYVTSVDFDQFMSAVARSTSSSSPIVTLPPY